MRSDWRQQLRTFAFERGGALTLAVLAFYVWQANPYIVENDQAEFSTLAATGGVAHPPGYPLHILWLRAWAWLPVASPALAASIATALIATLAVHVTHAAARGWGARPLAATAAVGVFAFAPFVARYHTLAEVFALNHLVVALVLWLSAEAGPLRGVTRAAALGLIAGLGLSNHLTCVLVAPVGLLGVARAARQATWPGAVSAACIGVALGLTPYLYLLIAPDSLMSWRLPLTLGDLVDLFLRRAYGGPLAFSGAASDPDVGAYLLDLGHTLARTWAWVLLPVGGVALIAECVRPTSERRGAWIALTIAVAFAGPILATRFDLPLGPIATWITRRFHLLPALLLVIPVALGLERILRWGMPRMSERFAGPRGLGLVVTLGLATSAITTLPYLARFQSPAMENEVRNALTSLPPNAVVIGGVNELDVGIRYLQIARGLRPDVLFFRWQALPLDWYRARLVAHGLDFTPRHGEDYKVRLAETILANGRPLFTGIGHSLQLEPLERYPHGVLMRVLPRSEPLPSLERLITLNRELFAGFDLAYPRPGADDETAAWMHDNYAGVWRRLGDVLMRAGQRAEAARAYDLAEQLAPRAR